MENKDQIRKQVRAIIQEEMNEGKDNWYNIDDKLKLLKSYVHMLKNSEGINYDTAAKYFTILYNFLIVERMYFDDVVASGKQINKFLNLEKLNSVDEVYKKFLELYDSHSKVRFAVETFDSIESVRQYLSTRRPEIYDKFIKKKSGLNEENFPTNDSPIDELIQKFKDFNKIESDKEAIEQYIKMAELRMEEAFAEDVEFSVNLWSRRLKLAKEKLAGMVNEIESFKELPYKEYGIGSSPYQRWSESIYKTYVQRGENYKHVSEDEFMKMITGKVEDIEKGVFNKNNIYRTADEKMEFLDNRGRKIGEVWFELVRDDDKNHKGQMMASYWINTENT